MKDLLKHLNKVFDHRIRLGIMSALIVHKSVDFNTLKEILGVTDGNLASHIKALKKMEYIHIYKQSINKKSNTKYIVSMEGKSAFKKHVDALEKLINTQ